MCLAATFPLRLAAGVSDVCQSRCLCWLLVVAVSVVVGQSAWVRVAAESWAEGRVRQRACYSRSAIPWPGPRFGSAPRFTEWWAGASCAVVVGKQCFAVMAVCDCAGQATAPTRC